MLHKPQESSTKDDLPTTIIGDSGRDYVLSRMLQDRAPPFGRVSLATHGNAEYVLKEVPKNDYSKQRKIYDILAGQTNYVRLLEDTVQERAIFVYKYFDEDLLDLVKRNLPRHVVKKVLKDILRGLADLHKLDLVHNDLKANNILINIEEDEHGINILKTQLTDLEDTIHLPPGHRIRGAQLGNWMWRSPEAHAEGPIEKPSDMFSFGIVCIYAITKKLVLYVREDEVPEGGERLAFVLERQISYFAEPDTFEGLMQYLGDTGWADMFRILRDGFSKELPRYPFRLWQLDGVDEDFKDLICGLTNFDPTKRSTAEQALAHQWFQDV